MGPGPVSGDLQDLQNNGRRSSVPLLPLSAKPDSPPHQDAMEVTSPASTSMGPPMHNSSPELEPHALPNGNASDTGGSQNGSQNTALAAAAATSSQQPKVINTAFIHKLYSMLEDPSIRDLIAWSGDGEGFIMSPSADFAKALATYFKHTNVSSFVRQLNMYGFHKVSDVFHNGQNESALWQFKHGGGNFRKGDLAGLREIKRRASRHTLIHRDSFPGPPPHKSSMSQPGTPADPVLDPTEARLQTLEYNTYEMHARLVRTEESNTALSAKCQMLNESLVKAHQWHIEMTHMITALVPEADHPVRRDASTLERDIIRQLDSVRNYEDPHESLLSGRQPYFSNMAINEPLSPRQPSIDERRTSLHAIPPRATAIRPPIPPPHHTAAMPPRRYGSIGTAQPPFPNYQRPIQPQSHVPHPPSQHALAHVQEQAGLNLGRRHTSADIRVHGWPCNTNNASSPLASGQSSVHWPSSPMQAPATVPEDQAVRDQLNSYSFGAPRQSISNSSHHTTTPPLTSSDTTPSALSVESNWSFSGSGGGSKFNQIPGVRHLDSAPQTRRSSMASNVHSLLNPAETAERDEEDPLGSDEMRKRKRMV